MDFPRKDLDLQILAEMMPTELWDLVLKRVEHEDDLQNVANASLVFRDLMSRRTTTFLFGKVWDILEPRIDYQTDVSREDIQRNSRTCADCGRTRRCGCHGFSWVVNLRQVCKTWKTCVDDYYVNGAVTGGVYKWTSGLTKSSTAAACVHHFAKTHQEELSINPFVGRSLELVLQVNEQRPQVLQMLTLYGNHVFDCLIRSNDDQIDNEFILQLGGWLKLMPNLQRLKLFFNSGLSLDNEELVMLLEESPLPVLKSLKRLELCETPVAVFNHLIQINSHLTSLYVDSIDEIGLIDVEAFSSLELEVLQLECSEEEYFAFLERVRPSTSVKMLELIFDGDYISWQRIFYVLEQKWSLCQFDLCLQLPEPKDLGDEIDLMVLVQMLRLNLRNVRNVNLRVDNLVSLDFLLPLKNSLVNLNLEMNYCVTSLDTIQLADEFMNSQIVRIVDYQYRLRESNIWDIFSSLKKICFSLRYTLASSFNCEDKDEKIPNWLKESIPEEVTCTRSDYHEYLRSRNNLI